MNKQCFRVIFSKTLQRLVVVSELAKSEGKSTEPSASGAILQKISKMRPLVFSLFCALGFVTFSNNVLAETLIIQADKSAPKNQQPIILQTANGLPQVNIQTPNDKGLSHNKYSQFDVAEKGAILNNSRTNTQTQQAGMIQANPYLARGEAKVILNEVNSNKPSVMKGYVEVAGKKADVIIANPSGLHCEGCGIINSDRATFTTGKPEIKNGQVDNFKVEAGKVKVSGKGLDNSRVDYTEIIARETEVNAGIWSKKETKVITGKNTVKRSETDKNLQIIRTNQPLAGEVKPQVAIDVSELGGMYSGKIHLIGTENGVGVRNAGHIGASFDSVVIDASGKIINTQYIGAQKDIELTSKDIIENKGLVYAKQQLNAKSQAVSNQQGTLLADNVAVQAKQINNQTGKLLANQKITLTTDTLQDEGEIISNGDVDVRLKTDFQLNQAFQVANNLTFVTEGRFTNQTEQRVGNQLQLTAKQISNPHQKTLSATQTFLNAAQITNSGTLDGSLTVIQSEVLNNLGTGRIYGDDLAIQTKWLNNDKEGEYSATIAARKRLDLGVDTLRNRDHSLIFSADDLFIGGKLNDHFVIEGNAKLIENQSATIEALGNGVIYADKLINEDRHLTLGTKYDYDKYDVYTPLNTSARYYGNSGKDGHGWMDWNNDNRHDFNAYFRFNDRTKGSVAARDWLQHTYTRETATTTIEKQDPAKILIGGNLTLDGGMFINDKSSIAVGNILWIGNRAFSQNPNGNSLNNQGITLENIDLIGDINRIDRGVRMQINAVRKRHGINKRVWVHDPAWKNSDPIVHPTEHFNFQLNLNPIGQNVEKTGTQVGVFTQSDKVDLSYVPSLYQLNPEAERGYLIETDPKFTDRKQWLSSDYMFEQLRHNFDNVHKRLGDGFYEQRLINEQINQLTGRRFIQGYNNDLEQYKALMNNGVKYAKEFNLAVGVGLTAKQMSELTTDMVWLVNKEITLADGRKVIALVPQVYLVARNSDITSRGAVISANQIIGNVDNLQNSGVIAGLDLTRLHSNQLENRGTILGDTVDLSAKQNLINLGGKIEAVKELSLYTGKNLEISSTLSSSQSADGNFARTVLDQLASVKVTGEGGRLTLHSDDNLTIKAANIESQGSLTATTDKALSITTLNVSNKEHYNGNADNYYRLNQQGEIGSTLRGKDGVHLVGMENATLRQATVNSENGETFIGSKGDVRIESGEQSEQLASSSKGSSKGWFSKTTETHRHYHDTTENIGSEIDGNNVTLYSEAGKVDIHGSAVVADTQLVMDSKEGVNITAATNTHYAEDEHIKTKSGLMGTGGIGFSVGKKKEQIEQDHRQQSAARSQVGSLSGDTIIRTDGHYQQTGSVVTSRDSDVDIIAKSANITAARSDYESNYKRTYEQKGVTVAVNIPVVQAIQAVEKTVNSAKSVGSSKNDRINALGAVNAGFEAWRTAEQVGKLAEAMGQNPAQALSQDVSVSITYGEQKSVETQHSKGNKAEKSQINAGGKVNIKTEGGGKNSTLTIAGSDVSGKGGTHLKAEGDVNILAVDENHLERSKNKSSGFNAGVAISYGSSGFAFGVTAGGNVAKGYGNGESQAWVGSQVGSLDSRTTIESGGDANIIGSQVKGKSVKVTAEKLNIQSLQDTMKYEGKQESASGQVTVGYGVSGSASYNKSKMNADMATVGQQAGIFAGDEGYDVDIQNHTELTAGLVTSTEKAEAEGKNRFSTGTLNATNLDNHANYKGSSVGVSASAAANFDTPLGDKGQAQSNKQTVNEKGEKLYQTDNGKQTTEAKSGDKTNKPILAHGWDSLTGDISMGFGSDKDSQSSQTISGINTQNLIIRDEQGQLEKTGKNIEQIKEEIKTDITTETAESRSGKLENRFDKEKVLKEIQTQVSVTKDFLDNAQEAKDKVIDYYQEPKRKELREAITDYHNANIENKEQYKAKIDELIQDIYALEHIRTGLDLATGVVAGAPKVMSATTLISVLDTESRRESLKNSLLAPPIEDANDKGKLYSNVGHNSGAFDGIKLGGVRMNYGIICGADNSRCETDEQGRLRTNEKGHIVYRGDNELKYQTITRLLEDRNVSGKLFGATGGFQATEGEIFGIKYKPGSFLDKLVETYAGQHDLVGGQWLFYDKDGNGNRNFTPNQEKWADRFSVAAVPAVTPTTVSHALPLEVRFLLFGVR